MTLFLQDFVFGCICICIFEHLLWKAFASCCFLSLLFGQSWTHHNILSHHFIINIVHHQHPISKVIKQCLDHKKEWLGKRSRKVKIIRSIRKGPELLAHLNSHYGPNQHKERGKLNQNTKNNISKEKKEEKVEII